MKRTKAVLGGLLLVSLVLGARAQAQGTLNVGANIGNVPWEFQDASGANVGFEIELVTKIAENLGKKVNVVNTPFNGLFAAVQSGRIDVAISSITITIMPPLLLQHVAAA